MKRLAVIVAMLAFALVAVAQSPPYWPTLGWRSGTPEELGFDSVKVADAVRAMRQKSPDMHSFLLVRNGHLVADASFYPYDGKSLHEVASVTKSVMTTLIGIAIDQGKLKLDDRVLSFFPEYTVANRTARKEAITVRHLASMSSGLDCTAANDEQTLKDMRASPNWVQFTLDREARYEPGTHFEYCSPAIHLLSPILKKATGLSALDFAKQYLFAPLGISDVAWVTDPQGNNRGSEGLYLHPQDMAKIGFLWLNGGVWDGKQVVSRAWVEDSVKVQMKVGEDDYGYGWWIATDEPAAYNAIGRGGQRIIVVPAFKLVLVTTGGGSDFSEIEAVVRGLLGDLDKTLPANPDGVGRLQAAVAAVAQAPAVKTVRLPATAGSLSGKTFTFEPNPLAIESLSFNFNDTPVASLKIKVTGSAVQDWPVALDGVYRLIPGQINLPMGLRGEWKDDQTFLLEYDDIGNNNHTWLQFTLAGDRLLVKAQETAHESGSQFEGKLSSP